LAAPSISASDPGRHSSMIHTSMTHTNMIMLAQAWH